MICRKCNEQATITIKKEYNYCKSCYVIYLNHKFRACIGKNKVIKQNDKVLVALSGGLGSIALLDLIHTGITLNTHKKLKIDPYFVHLTDTRKDGGNNVNLIKEQCLNYGFNLHIYNISSFTSSDNMLLNDLTTASRTSNDLIYRITQNVLANIARDMHCRLIFTAEPATDLAAKLLSDIVIGRGSQVQDDIGFVDNRHGNIKILRPLRDITREELQQYIKTKGLTSASYHIKPNNLQFVIDNFVASLEKDSPATVSTICKTADKIGSECNESKNICIFCKGKLDMDTKRLTSIQAIIFSRIASYKNKECEVQMEHIENADQEISDQSLFPHIHQNLCYCCSKSFAELDDHNLQKYILGTED